MKTHIREQLPSEQRQAIKVAKFLQRDRADTRMRDAAEAWVHGQTSTTHHDAARAEQKTNIRNSRKPHRIWD